MASDFGAILLKNQLKELNKNPLDGFSIGLLVFFIQYIIR